MKEIKVIEKDEIGRKTLLAGIGLGLLSLFAIGKTRLFYKRGNPIACAPPEQKRTMKMLSQDGRLVEVDVTHAKPVKQKVTDKELREWVKKS